MTSCNKKWETLRAIYEAKNVLTRVVDSQPCRPLLVNENTIYFPGRRDIGGCVQSFIWNGNKAARAIRILYSSNQIMEADESRKTLNTTHSISFLGDFLFLSTPHWIGKPTSATHHVVSWEKEVEQNEVGFESTYPVFLPRSGCGPSSSSSLSLNDILIAEWTDTVRWWHCVCHGFLSTFIEHAA